MERDGNRVSREEPGVAEGIKRPPRFQPRTGIPLRGPAAKWLTPTPELPPSKSTPEPTFPSFLPIQQLAGVNPAACRGVFRHSLLVCFRLGAHPACSRALASEQCVP